VKLSAVGESGKFCASASSQILRLRRRRQMNNAHWRRHAMKFVGIFLAVKAKPSSVDHALLIGYCIISLPLAAHEAGRMVFIGGWNLAKIDKTAAEITST
jgi:hypothetical protein